MPEFNLERAKMYEENKIPSFKLYYSLVNKQSFYLTLLIELVLILIANIFIPDQISKAFIVCIGLYLITFIFGIVVSFKAPNVIKSGFEIDIKKIKLINIVAIPFSLAFFTLIASSLVTIFIAFFITKNFQGDIYLDHIRIVINLALFFISTWLIFYVFHFYSDRELGRYIAIKKKLLSEGKSLTDILQIKETGGENLNLKISASNKFMYGCKIVNNDLNNLNIFLRTSPTKYTLIFGVAMFSLLTIGGTCLFAGVMVYFQESRFEPAAFIIGVICFGMALILKKLVHRKEWIVFNNMKRALFLNDKRVLSFTEIKDLKWEKDYLEYFAMQIPYFRLYAITNTENIELFRVSATDEVVREEVARVVAKLLGLKQ